MNRRVFMAAGIGSGITVCMSRTIVGATRATPVPKVDGTSPKQPVPLGMPKQIGDWTVSITDRVVTMAAIDIDVAITYHGNEPLQVFQALDFYVLGHDRHLQGQFTGNPDEPYPADAFFDTVVDGAKTEGIMPFRMAQYDYDHPDDVLFVVGHDEDTGELLRKSVYTYFSLNKSLGKK